MFSVYDGLEAGTDNSILRKNSPAFPHKTFIHPISTAVRFIGIVLMLNEHAKGVKHKHLMQSNYQP